MPNSGSGTFTPQPIPLRRNLPSTAVLRCKDAEDPSAGTEHLTNVRWMEIEHFEGAKASRAVFRYAFDDLTADPDLPRRFHDVLGLSSSGPGIVATDDRLIVVLYAPTGKIEYLFDGFALVPEANVSRKREGVAIHATGVESREWDNILETAVWRDATAADDPTANAGLNGLPIIFNPEGKANASGPDNTTDVEVTLAEDEGTRQYYPAFIDPEIPFDPADYPDGEPRRMWTLGMCARYIIGTGNPPDLEGVDPRPHYVEIPLLQSLDGLLTARVPAEGKASYDPADPSTYEDVDIIVPQRDVTGQTWPEALDELIRPYGFACCFELGSDGDAQPTTTLKIYKVADNANTALKDLYLQPLGEPILEPARSNTNELKLARDVSGVVNDYAIRMATTMKEGGFVLAPLFRIEDADPGNKLKFKSSNTDNTIDRNKYRLFGMDEAGVGHWSYADGAMVFNDFVDLADFFGTSEFAVRLRPGQGKVFSKDANDKPLDAKLYALVGYAGQVPGVWDGTGQIYPVHGGWSLDAGQLAIRLTCEDPNSWNIGPYDPVAALNGGEVRLVEWLHDPTKRIHLMLCTAIETDEASKARAPDRGVSPTDFTIKRVVDGRAQYKKRLVDRSSPFWVQPDGDDAQPGDDVVIRDDTKLAEADARARREAHQYGVFSGPVQLPRLLTNYRVGDRIRKVVGRTLEMRQGIGGEGGEGAPYPRVVGVSWRVIPKGFVTSLSLSDHRDIVTRGERKSQEA